MCPVVLHLTLCLPAFFLSLSFVPGAESSRPCPSLCICYDLSDLVDCRDQGFQHVPRGVPHGAWLLELGGNNLSRVATRAFAGLWTLRVLVLTSCQIQKVEPQAFFSLSFLEKLDLSWNLLTSLPVDFSAGLSALRELRLQHNSLQQLTGSSLEHLDNIEKLDLSSNQLLWVGSGAFRGLSRLRQLYLHNNRLRAIWICCLAWRHVLNLSNNNISRIDGEALAPLHSLAILALQGNNLHHLKFRTFVSLHTTATHITLSGNPWNCDCELHRVFSKILYVRHLHVDDYRNVTCRDPPQLAGASLSWVDSQLCMGETATVLVITVTVMVTVVAAVVMAERNRKRNQGKKGDAESQTQT
uniref:Si:ch211-237i5.4 n=1 Tax=Tetraodon nigroviridis TaxID=99883 RepID=H3D921_TETNG